MRRGEVLGLRWSDVYLDAGAARIAQTLSTDGRFNAPKTHRSSRSVSLPAFVVEALRRHRAGQNERRLICGEVWQEVDLVFDRGDGGPMSPAYISHKSRDVTRSLGMDLPFHGLRHGYATMMLSAGVPLRVTQGLLRHSTISITADLYTHVAEQTERDAAVSLDAYLAPFLHPQR